MDGSAVRLQRLARRYARRGFTECEASGVGVGVREVWRKLRRDVRWAGTNLSSEHHERGELCGEDESGGEGCRLDGLGNKTPSEYLFLLRLQLCIVRAIL